MDSEPFPGSSEPLVPVQSRKNRFKNDQIKKESIEAAVGKMAASEATSEVQIVLEGQHLAITSYLAAILL